MGSNPAGTVPDLFRKRFCRLLPIKRFSTRVVAGRAGRASPLHLRRRAQPLTTSPSTGMARFGSTRWRDRWCVGGGSTAESLLICFNVGLLWILALTLILLRREQSRLEWSRVVDGPWLRSPGSPKTGKIGGTVGCGQFRSSYSPQRSMPCRSTQKARCRGTFPSFFRRIRTVLRLSSAALGAGSRCSCG
jgi:hypothetical protein